MRAARCLIKPFTAAAVLTVASGCRDTVPPVPKAPPSSPLPSSTTSAEPAKGPAPPVFERIADAFVNAGRLWLRGGTAEDRCGALVSLDLSTMARTSDYPTGVCAAALGADGAPLIARRAGDLALVERLGANRWEHLGELSLSHDEQVLALADTADATIVLTTGVVATRARAGAWTRVPLRGVPRDLGVQVHVAIPKAGGFAYLGINGGEWGGGLHRIDLARGTMEDVQSRRSQELCAGPLNTECDPVTSVVPDRTREGCVVAALGLIHVIPHGRLLRVCGTQVEVMLEKPGKTPLEGTEAFMGLAAGRDADWLVGHRGVYRLAGQKVDELPIPKLENVGGIWLGRAIPGVVLVGTDVNAQASVSGGTLLVAPLE